MVFKRLIGKIINKILDPFGYRISKKHILHNRVEIEVIDQSYNEVTLPKGANDYLNQNNKRLLELKRLYTLMDPAVMTPSVWTNEHLQPINMKYFRGDNAYVWQYQDHNFEPAYAITTYYIKSIDTLNLLEKLKEDDEFGIYTYKVDNKIVSRDLLDSIVEIYFLEKHLEISKLPNVNILDIGAGYGRLAHRMVEALPNISQYYCTDAVPVSTFINEYYLNFRKVTNKALAIPINEVEDIMAKNHIDIAINIHSFSECTNAAINWWLRTLAKNKVRYLMIVPDYIDTEGNLLDVRRHQDYLPIVESNGYYLLTKEPKYRDPSVQQYGVTPTYHYLFELSSNI